MTTPPPAPADETWPLPNESRLTATHDVAITTAAPPSLPPLSTPARPSGISTGVAILLGLGALVHIAFGAGAAYLLIHRDTQSTSTVVAVTTLTNTRRVPTPARQRPVPSLVGQTFGVAQKDLDALGFNVTERFVSSNQPEGTVVGQTPSAATRLAKGALVTLLVAKATGTKTVAAPGTNVPTTTATTTSAAPAPAHATVPDLGGQREQAAVTALYKNGILASLVFVPAEDTLGTVEGQAKPAGSTIAHHSHMQINLSRGPGDKPNQTVPNTIGQTLDQALATINSAKLRLIYVKLPVTSRGQAGKIVQQSPLAGGSAPQNAQILVFLGAYQTG